MSEEERQAIIHLLDKQARYEYARKNNISFSDEDYEAYIIRQSMIDKDKEIERLNNIIKEQGIEDKPNYYVKGLEGSLKEYQDEVKRLNNIINELERYINEEYIYDELGMKIFDASKLQDKLQELKHKKIYGSVDSKIVYFDELGSDK